MWLTNVTVAAPETDEPILAMPVGILGVYVRSVYPVVHDPARYSMIQKPGTNTAKAFTSE